jgi:hypothetical protein
LLCPTSEPKSHQSSKNKTNPFPASPYSFSIYPFDDDCHIIILQYIHVKMIDACEHVILTIWFVLGWICGWDVVKSWLALNNF